MLRRLLVFWWGEPLTQRSEPHLRIHPHGIVSVVVFFGVALGIGGRAVQFGSDVAQCGDRVAHAQLAVIVMVVALTNLFNRLNATTRQVVGKAWWAAAPARSGRRRCAALKRAGSVRIDSERCIAAS
jgi:hypothetical protein